MIVKLFLAFTVIPLLELAILIRVGQEIGLLNTIALVVITGGVGAWLARAEGVGVLRRIRESIDAGEAPSTELLDGAFILAGGVLLLTPGLLTDVLGFLCLIPQTRNLLQRWAVQKISEQIDRNTIIIRSE